MTLLLILQIVLALLFLMVGGMKLMKSREEMAPMMPYVNDFSASTIKSIGLLEILGAIGVLLPTLLNVAPAVAGYAALGLALTMIGAAYVHLRRKEYPNIIVNIVILAIAVYVAYGRGCPVFPG